MDKDLPSRRSFMVAIGNLASAGWIATNWPQIAAAADHPGHEGHGTAPAPAGFTTFSPSEAAVVDAIARQIVPGGATPGAGEARCVLFIDNALGSFFAAQLPAFRKGLAEFNTGFAALNGTATPFDAAPEAKQIAWLKQVDTTPFFLAVRRLTVLGLIAWPKYGGNQDGVGLKLLGVIDSHYWRPPFGYYDQDYAGFQPYPGTKPYTA